MAGRKRTLPSPPAADAGPSTADPGASAPPSLTPETSPPEPPRDAPEDASSASVALDHTTPGEPPDSDAPRNDTPEASTEQPPTGQPPTEPVSSGPASTEPVPPGQTSTEQTSTAPVPPGQASPGQAPSEPPPSGPTRSARPLAASRPQDPSLASRPQDASDSPVVREHLRGLIEALLFVSPEPLSLQDLARLAQADRRMVREMLDELREHYRNRGLRIDEVAEGFCFRTNPLYGPFVRELTGARPVKLTRAQIETLAIVAYRQPITRPEIDDIRGVDSGPMLKLLLERELIRILGKKEEPGRPLLYGTSPHFLEFFGIRSLRELPTLRDFADLTEESRAAYQRILGEPVPELPFDMGGLAEGEGHLTPIQPPDPSGPPTSPGASTSRTKPPVDASQYEDDPSIPDDSATEDPEKASPPPEQEPGINESSNVDRVDDDEDDDDEDDDDEDDDDEDDDDEDDDDEDDDDEDDDEDDDDEDDDDE